MTKNKDLRISNGISNHQVFVISSLIMKTLMGRETNWENITPETVHVYLMSMSVHENICKPIYDSYEHVFHISRTVNSFRTPMEVHKICYTLAYLLVTTLPAFYFCFEYYQVYKICRTSMGLMGL